MRPASWRLGPLLLAVACVDGELGYLTPSDHDEIVAEVRRVTANPIVELEASEGDAVKIRVLERCWERGGSGGFVIVERRQTRWRVQPIEGGAMGWAAGTSHGQPFPGLCACLQPEAEPAASTDEGAQAPTWRNGSSAPCTRSEMVFPLHVQ